MQEDMNRRIRIHRPNREQFNDVSYAAGYEAGRLAQKEENDEATKATIKQLKAERNEAEKQMVFFQQQTANAMESLTRKEQVIAQLTAALNKVKASRTSALLARRRGKYD